MHLLVDSLIKKENLPIEYHRCNDSRVTGYGYFVYKDVLILNDYELSYDPEKQIWLVEIKDEYIDIEIEVEAVRARCNQQLGSEVCKQSVVLVDEELLKEHPDVTYEHIDLLPVSGSCEIDALKQLISQYSDKISQ